MRRHRTRRRRKARHRMRLDALLSAHGFMKVERPPEIWEADTEDVRIVPLLGEMIAAGLSGGAELGALTLNVSNVVVEAPEDEDCVESRGPLSGRYVAVTVSGQTDLGPDSTWKAGDASASGLLGRLTDRLVTAGARYAYVRRIPPTGSVTVFLPRLALDEHSQRDWDSEDSAAEDDNSPRRA